MTSIVFTQFSDDLPVDANKEYHVSEFTRDIGLHEIHKLCLFPEKLREYLQSELGNEIGDKGDIINATTLKKWTPLMIAARNGVAENIKLLLQSSALNNRSSQNKLGISVLVESNINLQNNNGWTALMLSCNNCNIDSNIECVKLLLEHKADVNLQDIDRRTALMIACINYDSIQCVKLLLEYGADINLQNKDGYTALMFACEYCNTTSSIECVKLLLEYGADINLKNEYGYTALMIACICCDTSSTKCIKLLLEYSSKKELDNTVKYHHLVYNILSNISNLTCKSLKQLKRLTHFDYNSILLFELKKCVFSQA